MQKLWIASFRKQKEYQLSIAISPKTFWSGFARIAKISRKDVYDWNGQKTRTWTKMRNYIWMRKLRLLEIRQQLWIFCHPGMCRVWFEWLLRLWHLWARKKSFPQSPVLTWCVLFVWRGKLCKLRCQNWIEVSNRFVTLLILESFPWSISFDDNQLLHSDDCPTFRGL